MQQVNFLRLRHKTYLKADLQSLGAEDLFDEKKADLGRLTDLPGMYLSDIVHEAVIEITENGTKASGASATTFDRIGGSEYFRMDKPSLVFIKDLQTGLNLFYARVFEPEPIY